MTRKIWGRASVPVIPGRDGATIPKMDCSACGAQNTPVIIKQEGDVVYAICVDSLLTACSLRYRQGRTPVEHQRYLRAQEVARRGAISAGGCGLASVPVG